MLNRLFFAVVSLVSLASMSAVAKADLLPADLSADLAAACSKGVPTRKYERCFRDLQSYFRDLKLRTKICGSHSVRLNDDQVLCKGTYADAILRSIRGIETPALIENLTSDLVVRTRSRQGEAVLDFSYNAAQYLGVSKAIARKYSVVLQK
jgi:hypothetical protein